MGGPAPRGGGYSGGNRGREEPPPPEPVTTLAKDTIRKWVGTKGQSIKLVANYFHLTMPPKDKVIYRYHVDVLMETARRGRVEVKSR